MDVGRRVLRQHRVPLAARDRNAAAALAGTYRLRNSPLETRAWVRHSGTSGPAAGGQGRGAALRRAYGVARQHPVSADNLASQRVIEANRGVLVEQFVAPAALGGMPELRYRVQLQEGA